MPSHRVLLVGATGHLGQHFPAALRERTHAVSMLLRPETIRTAEPEKRAVIDALLSAGATIVEGTLDDQASLERACADVDAVISCVTGPQLFAQPALATAAAKSGRVRRFFPSEWGVDPHLARPGSVQLLDWKRDLHAQLNGSGVPMTYVYSNAFASFWGASLGQLGLMRPPTQDITVFGTGNVKIPLATVSDIARLAVRMLEDDRTAGEEVAVVLPENVLSQREMIERWEAISGTTLTKQIVSAEAMDAQLAALASDPDQLMNLVFTQLMKSAWIEGGMAAIRPGVLDALTLYPEFQYERISEFLTQFRSE